MRLRIVSLFFLIITLSLISKKSNAQNKTKIDSLFNQLKEGDIDTVQMKLYRAIGDAYMYTNNKKAIEYFELSNKIANQLNITLAIASNDYSIGYCHLGNGDFDLALKNYLKSVRHYIKLNDSKRLVNAYLSISGVYSQAKNSPKAFEYLTLAEQLLPLTKDTMQQCSFIQQKGNYYFQLKQYDSAIYFSKKALLIAKQLKDEYSILSGYNDIAINYKKLNENALALVYIDSALNYFAHKNDMYDSYASILNNKASILVQKGDFILAKQIFDESLYYTKLCSNRYMEMENYSNIADMYETMSDHKQQAFYLKKYYSLKDSIFTQESENQITQLEADYQLEKKNLELLSQKEDIQSQTNKINISIVILIAVIGLLGLLFFNYRDIKKKKKLLETKNELISQQKIALENLVQIKDRLFSIISHDLRNPFNTLRSYLVLLDQKEYSEDKKILFKNQILSTVVQTGHMLDNLLTWANIQLKNATPKIVPIELHECILDIVEAIQPQAIQKNVFIHSEIQHIIVPTDQDILSIAIRNILTNAIKFSSEGQTIRVYTEMHTEMVFLHIKDEGIGLTEEQITQIIDQSTLSTSGTMGEKGNGLGLFLVIELLERINVPLEIKSELGKGSTFTLKLNTMNSNKLT